MIITNMKIIGKIVLKITLHLKLLTVIVLDIRKVFLKIKLKMNKFTFIYLTLVKFKF